MPFLMKMLLYRLPKPVQQKGQDCLAVPLSSGWQRAPLCNSRKMNVSSSIHDWAWTFLISQHPPVGCLFFMYDTCSILHCSRWQQRAICFTWQLLHVSINKFQLIHSSFLRLRSWWSGSCCDLQLWIFSIFVSWQSSGCWPRVLAPAVLLSDDVFITAAQSRLASLNPLT